MEALSEANVGDALPSFVPAVGQSILVEAGDVHAMGEGIVVLEVQQNSDVTYRLYDYGRPRELHLEEGIAVATGEPRATAADARKNYDRLAPIYDCWSCWERPYLRALHRLGRRVVDIGPGSDLL